LNEIAPNQNPKNHELRTRYFLRITEAFIPSIIFTKDRPKSNFPTS